MSRCVHNESKGGKSRLYRIFENMFARCYRKNNKSYKYCGAKGIRICNEWLNDKSLFFEWAYNNGYNETLSIDRIDNSKDYTPQNCRWVSRKIQDRNRTCNQTITYQNQTLCYADWEIKLGYRKGLLSQRIKHLNWDKIKALTTPPKKGVRIMAKFEQALQAMREGKKVKRKFTPVLWLENGEIWYKCKQGTFNYLLSTGEVLAEDWEVVEE